MNRILLVSLCLVVSVMLVFLVPLNAQASQKKPIELKAVSFLPPFIPTVKGYKAFLEEINDKAKGELSIKYIGGPEAVSMFDQAGAVRSGVIDMTWIPTTMYTGLIPGAEGYGLSRLTPLEERKSGAYDLFKTLHNKGELMYLGRGLFHPGLFPLCVNKRIERPQDLKGKKIAKGTIATAFLEHIGAVNVTMQDTEIYTALERGVIDGYITGDDFSVGVGLHEITKYSTDFRFMTSNIVVIMNLKKWKSLPKHLQDLIMNAQIEVMEGKWVDEYVEVKKKAMQLFKDAGVKFITFTPQDKRWFIDTLHEVEWGVVTKKYPEVGPKMKALTSK